MFSVDWFTSMAKRAISRYRFLGEGDVHAPRWRRRAWYWAEEGALAARCRMRTRSFSVSCLQLHADGKAALQLRDEVGRLGDVEGPGGDEEDVVGAHRARMFGVPRIDWIGSGRFRRS